MKLREKVFKKNINLYDLVRLNKTRSYRDGNLMYLNYEIVDNQDKLIFSINTCIPSAINSIDDYLKSFKDSIKSLNSLQYNVGLYNHMIINKWVSGRDVKRLYDSLADEGLVFSFLEFTLKHLTIQAYELYMEVDFYSLQTKKEYDYEELRIKESADNIISYIDDGFNSNDKIKQDEVLKMMIGILSKTNNENGLNNNEYVSWKLENNLISFLKYSINHPEVLMMVDELIKF